MMKNASLFIVAKNTNKRVVSTTKKGLAQTTLRTKKLYSSPDICGKEWQSKYQALHQDIINNN